MIADAGVTLAWQEPVSALVARHRRRTSSPASWTSSSRREPTPAQRRALASLQSERRRDRVPRARARAATRRRRADRPHRHPAIGADFVVVQGTDAATLRKGPGHYPDTTFPGSRGTVAIAGHRTTYLRAVPQRRRAEAAATRSCSRCRTAASPTRSQRTRSCSRRALWVTRDVGYDRLVLSACHPLYSAAERIIVFARLRDVQARGAAAR